MRRVTPVPRAELMSTEPGVVPTVELKEPEFARPELVRVPAAVTPPERVKMPVEFAWSVVFPVPLKAPEIVKAEPEVTRVFPALPTTIPPLMVSALAVLDCVRVRLAAEKLAATLSAVVEVPAKVAFGNTKVPEGRVSAPVPERFTERPPVWLKAPVKLMAPVLFKLMVRAPVPEVGLETVSKAEPVEVIAEPLGFTVMEPVLMVSGL